jgi:hypothetical protein
MSDHVNNDRRRNSAITVAAAQLAVMSSAYVSPSPVLKPGRRMALRRVQPPPS